MTPTTQLPNESNRAYEFFKLYLDMGPKRSQERVAKKLSISRQYVGRLSRVYKWRQRVSAAFLEDHNIEQKAKEQAALEHARMLEARREVVRENSWKFYQRFIKVAGEHLDLSKHASKPSDASRLMATAQLLGAIASGEQPSQAAPPTTVVVNVKRDADSDAAVKLFGQRTEQTERS